MNYISGKDFYKPCKYNCDTKNQLWCSIIADAHDSTCSCEQPFAHLLALIFPPGHTDRNLTINQIIKRDYKALCLGGGTEEESHGLADGEKDLQEENIKKEEEEYIKDEDLQDLIAAGEDAGGR